MPWFQMPVCPKMATVKSPCLNLLVPCCISLHLIRWQERSTLFHSFFSMYMERRYSLSKHENRKISRGSHIQGVGRDDPWLPACFPLLWERRIRTLHTGSGLLSPAWQIEPGSLHIFPFSWIFLILMFRRQTTWRELCALSYTFYFGNIMIDALQWLDLLFS